MMFYQLCLGLNHLHTNGVIHRDIKSLNIMMCKDGMVKIGDLGVSRQVGQETMMLQTFYGTPLYASPELCENKVRACLLQAKTAGPDEARSLRRPNPFLTQI